MSNAQETREIETRISEAMDNIRCDEMETLRIMAMAEWNDEPERTPHLPPAPDPFDSWDEVWKHTYGKYADISNINTSNLAPS